MSSTSTSLPSHLHSSSPWAQIDNQKTGCPNSSTSTGCWSFLQQHDARNTSHDFLKLPTTSLEMCTEILGCETGCHNYPVPDNCPERQYSGAIKPWKTREICKKSRQSSSLPPPLTSISGVRVQTQRGGGRLVITAFGSSGGRGCFMSERENGRLRLFLQKEYESRKGENGGKFGSSLKCGDGSGSKSLTSLPLCVALS